MADTSAKKDRKLKAEIEKYRKALAADPGSRVFAALADALRRAGEVKAALEVAQKGVEKHPRYVSGLVIFGLCLQELGDLARAKEVFSQVLRMNPENIVAQRALGEISLSLGEKEAALRSLRALVLLDPTDAKARNQLQALEAEIAPSLSPEPAAPSEAEISPPHSTPSPETPTPIESPRSQEEEPALSGQEAAAETAPSYPATEEAPEPSSLQAEERGEKGMPTEDAGERTEELSPAPPEETRGEKKLAPAEVGDDSMTIELRRSEEAGEGAAASIETGSPSEPPPLPLDGFFFPPEAPPPEEASSPTPPAQVLTEPSAPPPLPPDLVSSEVSPLDKTSPSAVSRPAEDLLSSRGEIEELTKESGTASLRTGEESMESAPGPPAAEGPPLREPPPPALSEEEMLDLFFQGAELDRLGRREEERAASRSGKSLASGREGGEGEELPQPSAVIPAEEVEITQSRLGWLYWQQGFRERALAVMAEELREQPERRELKREFIRACLSLNLKPAEVLLRASVDDLIRASSREVRERQLTEDFFSGGARRQEKGTGEISPAAGQERKRLSAEEAEKGEKPAAEGGSGGREEISALGPPEIQVAQKPAGHDFVPGSGGGEVPPPAKLEKLRSYLQKIRAEKKGE